MKNYFVILSPIIILLFAFVILYRLPVTIPKVFRVEMEYCMFDLGANDDVRNYIENILGHRRIFVNEGEAKWFYFSQADQKKVWPESPFEMKRKHYTIQAVFKACKTITGGYIIVSKIDTVHIDKYPVIFK